MPHIHHSSTDLCPFHGVLVRLIQIRFVLIGMAESARLYISCQRSDLGPRARVGSYAAGAPDAQVHIAIILRNVVFRAVRDRRRNATAREALPRSSSKF